MSNSAFTVGGGGSTGGGNLVYLGSRTASASATLDFVNIFSSSYSQYMVFFTNVVPATNGTFLYMTVGTGSSPTWVNSAYNWVTLVGYSGGTDRTVNNSDAQFRVTYEASHGASSATPINGSMVINGPNAASNLFGYNSSISYVDAGGGGDMLTCTGSGQQAAATYTSLRFAMDSGNITSGTIAIYGIATAGSSGTGGGGGMTLLSTQTASGSASLVFNGLFNSTYDQYVFVFNNILPATNNVILYCVLGTGGGPTYVTANYNWVLNAFLGGSTYIEYTASDPQITMSQNAGVYGIPSTGGNYCGQLWLAGCTGTSSIATGIFTNGYTTATTPFAAAIQGSFSQAAATFTAIKFYMSSGNITSGTIRMYGLQNS